MGGGNDSASQKFEPPEWTADLYPQAMEAAMGLVNRPYTQYAGMKVAPMNPWQHTAGQLTVDRALYGDPQTNQARQSLMNISGGGGQNPYGDSSNPFIGATNPYLDDKYLDQNIQNTAQDMAGAHQIGTAAQTDALAARAGAYGGSAHVLKQSNDAANLAKQVGNMATSARSADIGRKTSAAATDLGRNTSAWGEDMGRRAGIWNSDINNIMQASGMSLPFSQNDQASYDALNKYGGQHQNYTQSLMNEQFGEFQRQQNFPLQNLELLFSALARGSGQYGTQFSQQPGQSGLANGIGGAAALYGLLGQ